jgi:hypothetical protein
MKPIAKPSLRITLLFFIILSIKNIFDRINGLMFLFNKIAAQYALTILAGILCDFFFVLSRHLLAKIKIKNEAHPSESSRWFEYTIGMSGLGFVLVVLYVLQSLVWFIAPFKLSMLILCLMAGVLSGTVVYSIVKILKKFKKNEVIKFCIFTFGLPFMALIICIIVYLFTPSPKLIFRDFFAQRAGVEIVVTMCIMGIILYFASRRIKSS